MTFRAAKLLKLLKQAQMYPDAHLGIDFDEMTAKTIHPLGGDFQEVSLRGFGTSLLSTLDYLEDKEYIVYDYPGGEAYVKHEGWHRTEEIISAFCAFLAKSVLVPVIVSVITTLVTIWIKQLLG